MHSNHIHISMERPRRTLFFCLFGFCQAFCFPTPLQQSELGIGRFSAELEYT
uniref:Uncharacterized protein n=1 Tax=Setaria viridis TaxID=4556 RepID=A0A4U6T733_SETVI|nr:hypothetical protein SEVIR_9G466550v2 [Setaria viridis]